MEELYISDKKIHLIGVLIEEKYICYEKQKKNIIQINLFAKRICIKKRYCEQKQLFDVLYGFQKLFLLLFLFCKFNSPRLAWGWSTIFRLLVGEQFIVMRM